MSEEAGVEMNFKYAVRPGVFVSVDGLPSNLNQKEADRIINIINTMVINE